MHHWKGAFMSKEVNLATLGKFSEAVNTGNFDLFKEAVAPGCVDHDPAPGQAPGPDGYRMFFSQMRTAFPDLKVALEALVADDESIAIAYRIAHVCGIWRLTPCRLPNRHLYLLALNSRLDYRASTYRYQSRHE